MSEPVRRPKKAVKASRTRQNGAAPAEDEEPQVLDAEPVDLDLDSLERDGNRPGPFRLAVEGQRFTLIDPREIDWQDLMVAMRNPLMFIKFAMGDEGVTQFLALRVPEWKMEQLIIGYFKHFGMPDLPELRALSGS